jgi:glycosyltransferase involved in cell wall biosynthesis
MIKRVSDRFGEDLVLMGTRAAVPFEGLEQELGRKIIWLDNPDDIWGRREEFADRNLIIHTGWVHKGWLKFDRWMKRRGATIVFAADNSFKGNLRQAIGAIWFRLWLRRHFDAAIVPGRTSRRLLEFLGMPPTRIFEGYYGAYEGLYHAGPPIDSRAREFLFVGQLIERKGVDVLLDAYELYRKDGGTWDLRIVGGGPLADRCVGPGIIFDGFCQAAAVSEKMRYASTLVVPSREDHWATVVCEAAAAGTPVIASKWVGASVDLIRHGINGLVFHKMAATNLAVELHRMENWSVESRRTASAISLALAETYRSSAYEASFASASKLLSKRQRA